MTLDFIKNISNDFKSNSFLHAYLLEGNKETIFPLLFDFFQNNLKIQISKNPDFSKYELDTFKIKNGREIKEKAYLKISEKNNKKIFLISFNFITKEAQNSLLKLFEDPPSNTHFFIVTENAGSLLPTLSSRLTKFSKISDKQNKGEENFAKNFLESKRTTRIKLVEKIVKEKDKNSAIKILDDIEKELYKRNSIKEKSKEEITALKEIEKCRQFLFTRSPSTKMVLEHISLITPIIKE